MLRRALVILCIATAAIAAPAPSRADWPPDGVTLCTTCDVSGLLMLPDGTGGAYVAWARFGGDVSLQRVTASGAIAPGWPSEGLMVTNIPRPQDLTSIAPDGFGGVLLAWDEWRNAFPDGTTGVDVYVQRILPDGTVAPGWPANGAPATRAAGRQDGAEVIGDGTGGAYVSWDDETLQDGYLTRLSPDGTVAPGWPQDGRPVCVDPSLQLGAQMVPDGADGVLVVWGDLRDGAIAAYAQRFRSDGSIAPGWPANGSLIASDRARRQLLPDGAGGGYVSCALLGQAGQDTYYLQRFTSAGAIAPGWPEGGALVCQAPDMRSGLRMVPDGEGGVLLAWDDWRDFWDDEVFVQRMRGDGTRYPGWPESGQRATDNEFLDLVPDLAPDGTGGAYLTWNRYLGAGSGYRVGLHHLTGLATPYPGWPVEGRLVPTTGSVGGMRITDDGTGGAIVAWKTANDDTIRALRLGPDGPVAVTVSLATVEVEPGEVRLVWQVAGGVALIGTVERREEQGEWGRLAELRADGQGRLTYADAAVIAGRRYAYRLGFVAEGEERWTGATWVSVPRRELALRGFQPNPSLGSPRVAFELEDAAPARVEVYDVAGRRVASREVGGLGPGRHEIPLEGEARLAAGVYAIRLVQGGRVRSARGVVTR